MLFSSCNPRIKFCYSAIYLTDHKAAHMRKQATSVSIPGPVQVYDHHVVTGCTERKIAKSLTLLWSTWWTDLPLLLCDLCVILHSFIHSYITWVYIGLINHRINCEGPSKALQYISVCNPKPNLTQLSVVCIRHKSWLLTASVLC